MATIHVQGGLFDRNGNVRRRPLTVKIPLPSEHEEQAALISWAADTESQQTDELKREALHWLFAIPNGAYVMRTAKTRINPRTGKPYPPKQAVKLKAEGVKKGVVDLRLDWATERHTGLYIEMKQRGKRPAPEQVRFIKHQRRIGNRVEVCYTAREAASVIIEHMNLEVYAPLPQERCVR